MLKRNGYQVHHKLPLDDGGNNDLSNLILIKNDPNHKVRIKI
ncbi:HNH endonuclease signature motif containing protein [Pseudalkalibacillus sp. NRS-1564]